MRVLVPEKLADPGIELLRRDFEVDVLLDLSPEELLQEIGDYDGLIIQLDVALQQLIDEGIENVFERHVLLGRASRAGIKGMGLELFGLTRIPTRPSPRLGCLRA